MIAANGWSVVMVGSKGLALIIAYVSTAVVSPWLLPILSLNFKGSCGYMTVV